MRKLDGDPFNFFALGTYWGGVLIFWRLSEPAMKWGYPGVEFYVLAPELILKESICGRS